MPQHTVVVAIRRNDLSAKWQRARDSGGNSHQLPPAFHSCHPGFRSLPSATTPHSVILRIRQLNGIDTTSVRLRPAHMCLHFTRRTWRQSARHSESSGRNIHSERGWQRGWEHFGAYHVWPNDESSHHVRRAAAPPMVDPSRLMHRSRGRRGESETVPSEPIGLLVHT